MSENVDRVSERDDPCRFFFISVSNASSNSMRKISSASRPVMDSASENDKSGVASVPSVSEDGNRLGNVLNRSSYRKAASVDVDP